MGEQQSEVVAALQRVLNAPPKGGASGGTFLRDWTEGGTEVTYSLNVAERGARLSVRVGYRCGGRTARTEVPLPLAVQSAGWSVGTVQEVFASEPTAIGEMLSKGYGSSALTKRRAFLWFRPGDGGKSGKGGGKGGGGCSAAAAAGGGAAGGRPAVALAFSMDEQGAVMRWDTGDQDAAPWRFSHDHFSAAPSPPPQPHDHFSGISSAAMFHVTSGAAGPA